MPQFTQPSHRFGPAEGLLDALADALGDAIAGMAGGAAVNGRAAPALVLRDMGSDGLLAQFHDKVTSVVALVGTECDRLRPVGMRCDQRQCRQALGVAGGAGRHRADDQTVAVLHQRMAHKTQPRFFAGSLAKEPGIGIGGRGMRVVAAALATKVALAIAPRIGRSARAVFWLKALGAGPSLQTMSRRPRSGR